MSYSVICYKCRRSVEPLERLEVDKKARKSWIIVYCPYDRCAANLDIKERRPQMLWNGSYFVDETDPFKDR